LRAKNKIEKYSQKLSKVLEKEYFREEELQFGEADSTGFMRRLHITGQVLTPFQIKLLFKKNDQKNKWDVISGLNNAAITPALLQHRELDLDIFHDQSSSTGQSSPGQVQTPTILFSTKDRPSPVDDVGRAHTSWLRHDLDNPHQTSTSRSANSQNNEYNTSHVSVIPLPHIAGDKTYFGVSQLLRSTEAISEDFLEFFGENDAQLHQSTQSSQLTQSNKEILGAEHFIPEPDRSMTHSSDKQLVQANESGELVYMGAEPIRTINRLNKSMHLSYLLRYTLI
jgi:hypothetical protein